MSQDIIYTSHAFMRMDSRKISAEEIELVVANGEIIETYADDKPYPSCLKSGLVENRHIHVVLAENKVVQTLIVVTVYEPDPDEWNESFTRRKP